MRYVIFGMFCYVSGAILGSLNWLNYPILVGGVMGVIIGVYAAILQDKAR